MAKRKPERVDPRRHIGGGQHGDLAANIATPSQDTQSVTAWRPSVVPPSQYPTASDLPIDTGYNVTFPDVDPTDSNTWTVRMINQYNAAIYLWVHEIEASFTMQGSTGQSRQYRQFFPHHFAAPHLTVRGQMPNQYQYNKLAAFVRDSHYKSLKVFDNAAKGVQGRIGPDGANAVPTVRLDVRPSRPIPAKRNVKGAHKAWSIEGYIESIAAGSIKFENAPEFEFDIIISDSLAGLYTDDPQTVGIEIASWMDLFTKSHYRGTTNSGGNSKGTAVTPVPPDQRVFGPGLSTGPLTTGIGL